MADYDRDSVYSIDYNTDLDLSFTSVASTTTTDKTFASTSSARSSLARSSLTLSFNERLSLSFNDRLSLSFNDRLPSTSAKPNHHHHHHHLLCRPHRRWDPHWSAIRAAINMSFDGRLHLRHLKLLRHLGTGNLGRVFLCRLRDYHHSNPHAHFALKVVDKESLTPKKLAHVETEAKILSTLDHPFLPTLYAHIDVSHYTCLLIDYCSGGDLHFLLRKQPNYRLPLYAVRFYAAEVLVALEYLHSKGIVYRDLKPENILLREDGHIMLSDFDLCFTSEVTARIENFETAVGATRRRRSNESCGCLGTERRRRRRTRRSSNVAGPEDCVVEPTAAFSKSCVGTHEYLAPELIAGNGHSNGVDWWAFGVLIYELMHGTTPFKGINKDATLRNIASTKEAVFPRAEEMMEEEGTAEAKDLIRRLLVKDSRRRLGCARGAAEIKRHPFFDGVKWPLIRSYRPPEVRGGVVRKSKGKNQAGHHVIGSGAIGFLKRRRWLWRRLTHFLKSKGSKANNVGFNNGPKLKKIGPSR